MIERFFGNLAGIAAALKVSRQAVHKFVKANPDIKDVVDAEKARVTDLIEQSLINRAIAGESWAVCFYLKTQAKDRGYVEKQEHEHSGSVATTILYLPVKDAPPT